MHTIWKVGEGAISNRESPCIEYSLVNASVRAKIQWHFYDDTYFNRDRLCFFCSSSSSAYLLEKLFVVVRIVAKKAATCNTFVYLITEHAEVTTFICCCASSQLFILSCMWVFSCVSYCFIHESTQFDFLHLYVRMAKQTGKWTHFSRKKNFLWVRHCIFPSHIAASQ